MEKNPDWTAERLHAELYKLRDYLKTVEGMDTPQMFDLLFSHMAVTGAALAVISSSPMATLGAVEKIMQLSLDHSLRSAATTIMKRKKEMENVHPINRTKK